MKKALIYGLSLALALSLTACTSPREEPQEDTSTPPAATEPADAGTPEAETAPNEEPEENPEQEPTQGPEEEPAEPEETTAPEATQPEPTQQETSTTPAQQETPKPTQPTQPSTNTDGQTSQLQGGSSMTPEEYQEWMKQFGGGTVSADEHVDPNDPEYRDWITGILNGGSSGGGDSDPENEQDTTSTQPEQTTPPAETAQPSEEPVYGETIPTPEQQENIRKHDEMIENAGGWVGESGGIYLPW